MQLSFEKEPTNTNVPPRSRYAWMSDEEWAVACDAWSRMKPQRRNLSRSPGRHRRKYYR